MHTTQYRLNLNLFNLYSASACYHIIYQDTCAWPINHKRHLLTKML